MKFAVTPLVLTPFVPFRVPWAAAPRASRGRPGLRGASARRSRPISIISITSISVIIISVISLYSSVIISSIMNISLSILLSLSWLLSLISDLAHGLREPQVGAERVLELIWCVVLTQQLFVDVRLLTVSLLF